MSLKYSSHPIWSSTEAQTLPPVSSTPFAVSQSTDSNGQTSQEHTAGAHTLDETMKTPMDDSSKPQPFSGHGDVLNTTLNGNMSEVDDLCNELRRKSMSSNVSHTPSVESVTKPVTSSEQPETSSRKHSEARDIPIDTSRLSQTLPRRRRSDSANTDAGYNSLPRNSSLQRPDSLASLNNSNNNNSSYNSSYSYTKTTKTETAPSRRSRSESVNVPPDSEYNSLPRRSLLYRPVSMSNLNNSNSTSSHDSSYKYSKTTKTETVPRRRSVALYRPVSTTNLSNLNNSFDSSYSYSKTTKTETVPRRKSIAVYRPVSMANLNNLNNSFDSSYSYTKTTKTETLPRRKSIAVYRPVSSSNLNNNVHDSSYSYTKTTKTETLPKRRSETISIPVPVDQNSSNSSYSYSKTTKTEKKTEAVPRTEVVNVLVPIDQNLNSTSKSNSSYSYSKTTKTEKKTETVPKRSEAVNVLVPVDHNVSSSPSNSSYSYSKTTKTEKKTEAVPTRRVSETGSIPIPVEHDPSLNNSFDSSCSYSKTTEHETLPRRMSEGVNVPIDTSRLSHTLPRRHRDTRSSSILEVPVLHEMDKPSSVSSSKHTSHTVTRTTSPSDLNQSLQDLTSDLVANMAPFRRTSTTSTERSSKVVTETSTRSTSRSPLYTTPVGTLIRRTSHVSSPASTLLRTSTTPVVFLEPDSMPITMTSPNTTKVTTRREEIKRTTSQSKPQSGVNVLPAVTITKPLSFAGLFVQLMACLLSSQTITYSIIMSLQLHLA